MSYDNTLSLQSGIQLTLNSKNINECENFNRSATVENLNIEIESDMSHYNNVDQSRV